MFADIIKVLKSLVEIECTLSENFLHSTFKHEVKVEVVGKNIDDLTSELNSLSGVSYSVTDRDYGKEIRISYGDKEYLIIRTVMIDKVF